MFRDTFYDPGCLKILGCLTAEKWRMLKSIQVSHDPRPGSGFERSCVGCPARSRKLLKGMTKALRDEEIQLGQGIVQVPLRLCSEVPVEWVTKARGRCRLRGCSNKNPLTLLLGDQTVWPHDTAIMTLTISDH